MNFGPYPGGKACNCTVQSGMDFETSYVIIASCKGQGNRDKIYLGPRSARVESKCGNIHFWVIKCHESNGDVFFFI